MDRKNQWVNDTPPEILEVIKERFKEYTGRELTEDYYCLVKQSKLETRTDWHLHDKLLYSIINPEAIILALSEGIGLHMIR